MKKWYVITGILALLLVISTSTYSGKSDEVDRLKNELTVVKAELNELQSDKEAVAKKHAKALAYAEFLDVLYYPAWKSAGITPRFSFATDIDWFVGLKNTASAIGDTRLSNLTQQFRQGIVDANTTLVSLMDYCLAAIETNLK